MTERTRTTISIDPAVYAIFQRMAEVSGQSVSRCMGDWLSDTSEGAQFLTNKISAIRSAPSEVMRQLHDESQLVAQRSNEVMQAIYEQVESERSGVRSAPAVPAPRSRNAPSSNTGLKSPSEGSTSMRKRA